MIVRDLGRVLAFGGFAGVGLLGVQSGFGEVSLLARPPFGQISKHEIEEQVETKRIEGLDETYQFVGAFIEGNSVWVSVTNLKTGKHRWYLEGDTVGDLKIESYNLMERELIVSRGEFRGRLSLRQRSELVETAQKPTLPRSFGGGSGKPVAPPKVVPPSNLKPPSRIAHPPKNFPTLPGRTEKA